MKTLRNLAISAIVAAGLTLHSAAQVQTAGSLYVDVDATSLPLGITTNLANAGTAGGIFDFTGVGVNVTNDAPTVIASGGATHGVLFSGRNHFQHAVAAGGAGMAPPASLVGLNPTVSIEAWVLNQSIADEEIIVSWGQQNGTNALMAFCYGAGSGAATGAVGAVDRNAGGNTAGPFHTLASPNLNWGAVHPPVGVWHHLVYTFDGPNRVNRLYVDGIKVYTFTNSQNVNTWQGVTNSSGGTNSITIAAKRGNTGNIDGLNNATRGSFILGKLRIHSGVLSDANVANNFAFERATFTTLTPASVLTAGPINRYSFNEAATGDAVGTTIIDSVGGSNGVVKGIGVANSANLNGTGILHLNGRNPTGTTSGAYVDLPNRLLSSLSVSNGGPGQVTFETWATMNDTFAWSTIFSFGSSSIGEIPNATTTTTGSGGRNWLTWGLLNNVRAAMRLELNCNATNNLPPGAGLGGTGIADVNTDDSRNRVPFVTRHSAVTWDEATGDVRTYVNGIQTSRANAGLAKFNSVDDVNCWLGRSPFSGDGYMSADYDEFRIYNHVLTPGEIALSYEMGPDNVLTNLADRGALSSIQITPAYPITNGWVGAAAQLKVTATYAIMTGVDVTLDPGASFSSSNTNITSVSSNGFMRFLTAGVATINAAFGAATTSVTITNLAPPSPTLIHRYSFTGGLDYSDSVGGATGSANGTAIADGTGKLILDPSGQGYVSLPANLLDNEEFLTIEAWVDPATSLANVQLWAFGDQNALGQGRKGLFLSTQGNLRTALFDTDPGFIHEQNAQRNGGINSTTNQHIVGVYNPLGGYVSLYLNGVFLAQSGAYTPLTTAMSNTLSYIGRSLYQADPYWSGSMNEFRIWRGALTQQNIAVSDAAGPNSVVTSEGALGSVSLSVPNTNTVVTVAQQASFLGNFAGQAGVNLFNYGETNVTVSSTDTNVLTINSTGLVTAVGQGTAKIIANYGGFSATNTITVANPAPTLQHRYSFNVDANDSVGGANGTLQGGATLSGGKVVLDTNTSGYVELPGNLISGYFAVTTEFFADFPTNLSGSWLFGVGNKNGLGNGANYLYFTPHVGNNARAGITGSDPGNTGEQNVTFTNGQLDNQTNVHIAIVTHPFLGFEQMYVNGQLRATNAITTLLSQVGTNFAYLGRSLYDVGGVGGYPAIQTYINASIDEVRIYQGVLSASQIAIDAAAGPNNLITNPGTLLAVRVIISSNMLFNADQVLDVRGDFSIVTNVNLFGYTNVTITSLETNVITTNAATGSIHAAATGQATVRVSAAGVTNNTVVTVTPRGGPFLAARHHYAFNGDANDSVGTANGILKGNASIAAGALLLPGGPNGSNYVDLPNGLVSSMTNATFEIWARQDAVATWSRILDFGSASSGVEDTPANGTNYLFWTLADGQGNQRFAVTTNGAGAEAPQLVGLPTVNGQTNQYVVTYDPENNVDVMYTNGVRVITSGNSTAGVGPQNTAPFAMSNFTDINVWIGRSQYIADVSFNGAIFDVRIYEGAFNSNEVAARFAAGMDGVDPFPSLTLATNGAGQFTLSWPAYAVRYGLQSRTNLTSGSWSNVAPFVPVTTNGVRRITVAPTGSAQYFRLTD